MHHRTEQVHNLVPKKFGDPKTCQVKKTEFEDVYECLNSLGSLCPYVVMYEHRRFCSHHRKRKFCVHTETL